MKKILSFLLLLSSVAVLNLQAQVAFKYNGHTYQNGDNFVVVLEPNAFHAGGINFVNQGQSTLQNMIVTMTPIEMSGIDIWGLCAGACRLDSVSNPFDIPFGGEYADFTMDLTIDETVAQPYSIYKMKVSNDEVASSVIIRFQAYTEGINDVASSALTAYPNPAQGNNVNISYDVNQPSTLAIYDMQGRVVRSMSVSGSGNAIVDNLPAGIYTYCIMGSTTMQKLIVR